MAKWFATDEALFGGKPGLSYYVCSTCYGRRVADLKFVIAYLNLTVI